MEHEVHQVVGPKKKVSPFVFSICMTASLLNGYAIEIFGITVTPERMIVVPALLMVLIVIFYRGALIEPNTSSILVLSWIVWALLACLLSDQKSWALKEWFGLVGAISFYFIIHQLRIDFLKIFKRDIIDVIGWIYGPFMVFVYLTTFFNVVEIFESLSFVVRTPDGLRLQATFLEPNFFGALLVPFLLLYLATYRCTAKWWIIFVGLNMALLFTLSRSPWAAYLVSLSLYYVLTTRKKLYFGKLLIYVITIIFMIVVIIIASIYLSNYFGDDSLINRLHSIKNRFLLFEIALGNIANNPIIGNGIFTFSIISSLDISAASIQEEGWIANIILLVFHDTGIIGFLIFSAIFIVILYKGIKLIQNTSLLSKKYNKIAAALLMGGVSLFITGMTIPIISHAVFWVFWAIADKYFTNSKDISSSYNC